MKALVVDESAVMRKILTGALSKAGIEDVIHAGDGKEAVDAVDADDFAVVLMDWNMPVMTGIEATHTIKKRMNRAAPPIVAITASAFEEEQDSFREAGADAIILKPFNIQEVNRVIARIDTPSTIIPRICARFSVGSLFILPIYDLFA